MSTFTHTPRPPHVSAAPYQTQRRFGPPNCVPHRMPEPIEPKTEEQGHARLSVFRDGEEDVAELNFSMGLLSRARIDVSMTPSDLRELAARLLDAAHDIQTNPAAKLMAELAAEECTA